MKQTQPIWLKGIVTLKVNGHYPERFFDFCVRHQIPVWSIKKQSDLECLGDIYLKDIKRIRQLRRKTHYKLSFVKKRGFPFFYQKLKGFKQLLVTLLIAILFFLYLTQSIWFIEIEGVSTEMRENIIATLEDYGVKKGQVKFLIDNPLEIQRKLLNDYPDILWVGIVPNGITYQLEVITKKQPPEQDNQRRTHLYAKKDGVISEMFVAKGRPLVGVNDFVRKGQLLVTGELNHIEDKDTEEDDLKESSETEAEIYATTWYESQVTIPLEGMYQTETGQTVNKYHLQIGSFQLPIWGFRSTGFEFEYVESSNHGFSIGDWTPPILFKKNTHKEIVPAKIERSEDQAIAIGLQQARQNLLRNLGQTTSIIDEKILHQTTESGKVNLHVYFTVKENIVNTIDMNQGD
ncbi:sporulation protein YqfD [Amphibacillus sp. Q70]|uniref:sporulation protein YqfD n=1 Tax=Amphibacillus sp. Q70 TaxID=3453416 RepID=UPI003F8688D8